MKNKTGSDIKISKSQIKNIVSTGKAFKLINQGTKDLVQYM